MKHIKRFNEQIDTKEISSDRISEIIDILNERYEAIQENVDIFDKLNGELTQYKSNTNQYDQIDESIINLDSINGLLSELSEKINIIKDNIESYNNDGRKYLF
jgi:hypothetical protein